MNNSALPEEVPTPHYGERRKVTFSPASVMATPSEIGVATLTEEPEKKPDDMASPGSNFLPDLTEFDLTVEGAQKLIRELGRKVPSLRTLQRWCQDGKVKGYKISRVRGGNPVQEWLVSSASIIPFADGLAIVTPEKVGDAKGDETTEQVGDVMATPSEIDDATKFEKLVGKPDVMATPEKVGDATDGEVEQVVQEVVAGDAEKVDLLIENAKLSSSLDAERRAKEEAIEDKKFFREELRQSRQDARTDADQNRQLIQNMHKQSLEAVKVVSLSGRKTEVDELVGQSNVDQSNSGNSHQTGALDPLVPPMNSV